MLHHGGKLKVSTNRVVDSFTLSRIESSLSWKNSQLISFQIYLISNSLRCCFFLPETKAVKDAAENFILVVLLFSFSCIFKIWWFRYQSGEILYSLIRRAELRAPCWNKCRGCRGLIRWTCWTKRFFAFRFEFLLIDSYQRISKN